MARNRRIQRMVLVACVFIGICLIVHKGSKSKGSDGKSNAYMDAVVNVVKEDVIIATDMDGKEVEINREVVSSDGVPDLKEGEEVRIVFNSSSVTKEDSKIKIGIVFAIYKLEELDE